VEGVAAGVVEKLRLATPVAFDATADRKLQFQQTHDGRSGVVRCSRFELVHVDITRIFIGAVQAAAVGLSRPPRVRHILWWLCSDGGSEWIVQLRSSEVGCLRRAGDAMQSGCIELRRRRR
jgi:hypothetical protein